MVTYLHNKFACVYMYLHICRPNLHVCEYIYFEFACVCIYIYIHASQVYVCVCVYLYIWTPSSRVGTYIFIYMHTTFTCVRVYMFTLVHADFACGCVYILTYTCRIYVCGCIYLHTCTQSSHGGVHIFICDTEFEYCGSSSGLSWNRFHLRRSAVCFERGGVVPTWCCRLWWTWVWDPFCRIPKIHEWQMGGKRFFGRRFRFLPVDFPPSTVRCRRWEILSRGRVGDFGSL